MSGAKVLVYVEPEGDALRKPAIEGLGAGAALAKGLGGELHAIVTAANGRKVADAAAFWSGALGMPVLPAEDDVYQQLDASKRDLHIEVQSVSHESRLHLDIETDDLDAEVARLEKLGAKRVAYVKRWWVMEAPTGQRFCVVRAKHFPEATGINEWK